MSSLLKNLLLPAWYYGTLPVRHVQADMLSRSGRLPVMILFYHRVADRCPNPWTISRRGFARQVDWLQKHFDLVSLEEAQRRIRLGSNTRPAVSITFDDGYAENYEYALPLLVERGIPCTYFITTENVLTGKCFPHDIAAGELLPPNSIDQVRWMADQGIEIGAHTQTHLDLGPVTDEVLLRREIVEAGQQIEYHTRRPVRYFAFPFGQHANMSTAAIRVAYEAGYEAVLSAYGGYNTPGEDSFHLQRIHADPGMIRLKNWLTLDPRKFRMTERFQYTLESEEKTVEGVLA